MAKLNYNEKTVIESFLGMKSGYVMDFSNTSFQEFVFSVVEINIDEPKYQHGSNSKANRLRKFITIEPDNIVGKLLYGFCEYWLSKVQIGEIDYRDDELAYKECVQIAEKLQAVKNVEFSEYIEANTNDKDFEMLAKAVRSHIDNDELQYGLDRLHTFTFWYIRELCKRNEISFSDSESLNAVFGKYVKNIIQKGLVESSMSEKILKYSINILDAFNDIRNNKSFAHANSVLNYEESVLIFNNITNTIKFIQVVESKNQLDFTKEDDELPF